MSLIVESSEVRKQHRRQHQRAAQWAWVQVGDQIVEVHMEASGPGKAMEGLIIVSITTEVAIPIILKAATGMGVHHLLPQMTADQHGTAIANTRHDLIQDFLHDLHLPNILEAEVV